MVRTGAALTGCIVAASFLPQRRIILASLLQQRRIIRASRRDPMGHGIVSDLLGLHGAAS
jgi:hypothetical protein